MGVVHRESRYLLRVVLLVSAIAWSMAESSESSPVQLRLPSAMHPAQEIRAGERIYRDGFLPSGTRLVAERAGSAPTTGKDAACVNCHRRSAMGSQEGQPNIPAITGAYLFGKRNGKSYSEATLARALREGIAADGHELSYLMPRFALDDRSVSDLSEYLKALSRSRSPGVSGADTLEFATIFTPDADPAEKRGVLSVLREMFVIDDREGRRVDSLARRSIGRTAGRTWVLHVWELTGASESWSTQLEAKLRATPVFAVISGVGGRNWTPVHQFCERQALPCLFPEVDLPASTPGDVYSLYFSRGVLLEANLLADRIKSPRRVLQIAREGDIGVPAAHALSRELRSRHLDVSLNMLPAKANGAVLSDAVSGIGKSDALVLWLRPVDLQALPLAGSAAGQVLVSGLMGGLEHAPLPAAWRAVTQMAYPFDLPETRRAGMNYPLGWFHLHQIPVVDERAQTDAYLACVMLADALTSLRGTFSRDYLLEQFENQLDHRLVDGYYRRLGLGVGQRFASKGGYVVRFAGESGARIVPIGDWIVPDG